jgi:hypothetical protein
VSDGLTNILKKLWQAITEPRVTVNVEYVSKNFKRLTEKKDPVPINIKGFELACEYGKVIDVGNSKAVTLRSEWLDSVGLLKHYFTDEKGEKQVLLTKPKQEEIPAT